MGTAPILLAWGDDLLLIEEAVAALGARMAAEDAMGGGLPEKVRLKAEGRGSGDGAEVLGELRRRLGTGGLFGGGSLMVVAGAGRLGRTKDLRATLNDTLANMAPGNGVVRRVPDARSLVMRRSQSPSDLVPKCASQTLIAAAYV
ncbi:MAG: hypothetical protein EBR48_02020 [bacterium]|nr:hypothetical protein [Candidatus Aquidulcis frankliniae]